MRTAGTATGGEGNDVLIGIEEVTGSSGADSMRGSAAADRFRGSAGSDTILGVEGNDTIYGGDTTLDNVTVAGTLHNDLLIGGAGRDTIYVDAGVDTVFGGDSSTDGSPRLPFIKAGLLDRDVLSLTQANTSVINLSTRTYTLDTSYGTGSGSYAGIAEIWGSAGKDIVSGRTSASAADLAGGTEIWLSLNGGSDEVNGETYGVQQRWATGPMVSYTWSLTPVQVVYTANQATVAYSASGVQLAGQDRLTNVGYINGSKFADSFDLTQATTNHLGFATSPLFGRSWITLNLSRGGGDTVIGNGWTMLSFAEVDASTNDQGLSVDLRNSSANLSNLSFQGTSLSTLSYSGVFALIGTKYNDRLIGGVSINATEYFEGLDGNDTIDGGSGWDVASYSHSAARITVNLAQGSVVADAGGAGQDQLRSVEAIRGSNFNDILDARGFSGDAATSVPNRGSFLSGANEISPEGGNDTIHGNGATELSFYRSMVGVTVDLGTGVADARLEADKATEAYKTQGRDAFSGVYRITGSSLDDQLLGGGPGLSIVGQFAGLEVYTPGPGHDTVDGRGGADLVTYEDAPAGIVVDLRKSGSQVTNDGWGFTDHLIGVRLLMGSHLGDSIRGADSAGYESFWGMKGSDSIDGGGGDDEISYSDDPSGVVVKLGAWVGATGGLSAGFSGSALDGWGTIDLLQGIEGVEGSAFDDEITGNAADNRLDGGAGNDTLDGGTGNDWADYNDADESVVVNLETGFASSDGQRLIFSMANLGESLRTTTGKDKLISIENIQGGAAGDQIVGSSLANILQGESGDDTLRGGAGNDTLNGGSGIDTAVFSGPRSAYAISFVPSTSGYQVVSTAEGHDTVLSVERFIFSDGVFDAPQSSTKTLSGMAYHWNSHVLLSGVSLTGLYPQEIHSDLAGRFDLRSATLNSTNNTLSIELWMNNSTQAVSNFDFTSQTSGTVAASFVPALNNTDWTVTVNAANPDRVVVAGYVKDDLDSVSGSVKLGTIQYTLSVAMSHLISFTNVEIGSSSLPDLQVSFNSASSSSDGQFLIAAPASREQLLSAHRTTGDGSSNGGVTASDALAALMIAVEINPNPDPDGAGPRQALMVSPYQVIAADVNQDGKVSSLDALTILKMAVGRADAPSTSWIFVPELRDYWDDSSELFALNRVNASWDSKILVPVNQAQLNLVGLTLGDVNGSWSLVGASKVEASNPNHFQTIATLIGAPLDQWGIVAES